MVMLFAPSFETKRMNLDKKLAVFTAKGTGVAGFS
jgi:hypothetical protein